MKVVSANHGYPGHEERAGEPGDGAKGPQKVKGK